MQWGLACTDAVQAAVRSLPRDGRQPSQIKAAAFRDVFAQIEDLIESMDKLAKWMRDAETDDIVELQRVAKRVSEKVRNLVGLKGDHLMKQYNSITASRN